MRFESSAWHTATVISDCERDFEYAQTERCQVPLLQHHSRCCDFSRADWRRDASRSLASAGWHLRKTVFPCVSVLVSCSAPVWCTSSFHWTGMHIFSVRKPLLLFPHWNARDNAQTPITTNLDQHNDRGLSSGRTCSSPRGIRCLRNETESVEISW